MHFTRDTHLYTILLEMQRRLPFHIARLAKHFPCRAVASSVASHDYHVIPNPAVCHTNRITPEHATTRINHLHFPRLPIFLCLLASTQISRHHFDVSYNFVLRLSLHWSDSLHSHLALDSMTCIDRILLGTSIVIAT